MSNEDINYSVTFFIAEIKKGDGTDFPPSTLRHIVLQLQKFLELQGRRAKFLTGVQWVRTPTVSLRWFLLFCIMLLIHAYCLAMMYRLQHCLEWVMRVYTSKLTPDSVVTYLLHNWARSLWLFCLVWHVRVMIKVQYTSTDS